MPHRVILLAGLGAVLLILAPAQADASCKGCNLARRDCRAAAQTEFKLCKGDCRLNFAEDPDGRRACYHACKSARSEPLVICDADRVACNDTCSKAAEPACPGACTVAYRECSSAVRGDHKTCKEGCKGTSGGQRDACRDTASADRETCRELDDPGACLDGVGEAQGACLDTTGEAQSACREGCAASAEAGIAACTDVLNQCVAACPPEEP
jgi:hypothetical protein